MSTEIPYPFAYLLPVYNKSILSFLAFFFMCVFNMYIAPGRSRQPIGDNTFMTTERPFLFAHMLKVSK